MLKRALRKIVGGQKGQVLPIVLILLIIGGLLIVPTLNYASTSLKTHQVTETKAEELYAADSGMESALHWIIQGKELGGAWTQDAENHWTRDTYYLNDRTVNVTVEEIAPEAITEAQRQAFGLKESDTVYEITSTATTDSGSSTTIIECYVVRTTALADEGSYTLYPGDGNIEGGNVIVEADGTVNGNIEEGANVYGKGDLIVNGNIEDSATVYVNGSLTVNGNIEEDTSVYVAGDLTVGGNVEEDTTVCVAGDLTVDGNIEANAKVLVEGNLVVDGNIEDEAVVCVAGDLAVGGNIEVSYIYVGGTITVGGNMEATNLSFAKCPFCCGQCPLVEEVLKILTFGM